MKDYLESEGYIVKSPKQAIKQAFQIDLITDGELWISALDDRDLTSHTYDKNTTNAIIEKINNKYFNIIEKLYEFFKKENEE